ncbi:MAG: hypothetical protein WBD95_24435 [Xanthobacteraceae bacterium]
MTDAEIRGRLLKHFYELRDVNGGWVPTSEIILSPDQVGRQAIASVCQHLAEAGHIRWEPLNPPIEQHAIGRAKITGTGIDVVTGARVPTIDIHFPNMGQREVAVASALVPKKAESKSSEPEYLPEVRIPPTSARESQQKLPELVTLKPTFMGMSIDLKELWRRFFAWRKNQK